MPGTEPGFGEIVYSNGYATMALARGEGCEVIDLGIVPDRLDETIAAVRRARDAGADMLVTTGGASVGDYDLVQKALAAEGLALSFWKVALRPGRPMMHGRLGAMHVLGLPGNPVSAYVCAVLFLVPLIRRLAGRADVEPANRVGCARLRPAGERRAGRLSARRPRRRAPTDRWRRRSPSRTVPCWFRSQKPAVCWSASRMRRPPAPAARCDILKLGL